MSNIPQKNCWVCESENISSNHAMYIQSPTIGVIYCHSCAGYPLDCDRGCGRKFISKIKPWNGTNCPCTYCGNESGCPQFKYKE